MPEPMPKRPVDLDARYQKLWVTEAQYTGGSLIRNSYDNFADYMKAFTFLRDQASTDWVRGYRLSVTIEWEKEDDYVKED